MRRGAIKKPSFGYEKLNNSDDQLEEKSYDDLVSEKTGNITVSILRDQYPGLLDILLMDRTTKKNIIWANDNYRRFGNIGYGAEYQIKQALITGIMDNIIMPRAIKDKVLQKERTKERAEVFTLAFMHQYQLTSMPIT